MNDHKFTDEEVVSALEHCAKANDCSACEGCPFDVRRIDCVGGNINLLNQTLALVNRQKAEIERLEAYNANLRSANAHVLGTLQDEIEKARAEAWDELCDALKERVEGIYLDGTTIVEIIDEFKEAQA